MSMAMVDIEELLAKWKLAYLDGSQGGTLEGYEAFCRERFAADPALDAAVGKRLIANEADKVWAAEEMLEAERDVDALGVVKSELEAMERRADYYRNFHHTCVGWYITVMGLFIAGIVATSGQLSSSLAIILTIASIFACIVFSYCIFHYAARINYLNGYVDIKSNTTTIKVPSKWRTKHKKEGRLRLENIGKGDVFFFIIIIFMQITLITLLFLKAHENKAATSQPSPPVVTQGPAQSGMGGAAPVP